MKIIKSNTQLEQLHNIGDGLIYNDFSRKASSGKDYNVLHAASCDWVMRSNINIPKYFFNDIDEAVRWLQKHRGREGRNWKRCGICHAETLLLPRTSRKFRPLDRAERAHLPERVFTEAETEKILIQYLKSSNYKIRRQVRDTSGIIDVVADGPDAQWLIEVKGEDKGGYGTAEMNFQIGLGQVMSRMKDREAKYGLAFPITGDFIRVLHKYDGSFAFEKLEIYLIPVKRDGSCRLISPLEVVKFLEEI